MAMLKKRLTGNHLNKLWILLYIKKYNKYVLLNYNLIEIMKIPVFFRFYLQTFVTRSEKKILSVQKSISRL